MNNPFKKYFLSRFTHFCVETNWTKSCIGGGGVCPRLVYFCGEFPFYTFLILLDEVALHQTCKQCNIGKYLKVFVTKTHTPFYMLLKTDLVSKSKFVCVDSFITRWRRWLVYGLIGHWKSNRSSSSSSGSIRSGTQATQIHWSRASFSPSHAISPNQVA